MEAVIFNNLVNQKHCMVCISWDRLVCVAVTNNPQISLTKNKGLLLATESWRWSLFPHCCCLFLVIQLLFWNTRKSFIQVYTGLPLQPAHGALPDPVCRAVITPLDGAYNPRSVDRLRLSTQAKSEPEELVNGHHKPALAVKQRWIQLVEENRTFHE